MLTWAMCCSPLSATAWGLLWWQRPRVARGAALAPDAKLLDLPGPRQALVGRDGLAPGDELRPGALGGLAAADVGVVGRRLLVAGGDEGAALRVVEVEVLLAALEAGAAPDGNLLQQLVAHPGGERGQAVAALVGRRTVTQVVLGLSHGRASRGPPGRRRKARTSRAPAGTPSATAAAECGGEQGCTWSLAWR